MTFLPRLAVAESMGFVGLPQVVVARPRAYTRPRPRVTRLDRPLKPNTPHTTPWRIRRPPPARRSRNPKISRCFGDGPPIFRHSSPSPVFPERTGHAGARSGQIADAPGPIFSPSPL
jgi:hypothetical protein